MTDETGKRYPWMVHYSIPGNGYTIYHPDEAQARELVCSGR